MKQITDKQELRLIQLGILDYIHSFCSQNGIKYSLAFGTLLGAVRHKGYIPWDDDIDICMPRADYERFLCLFNNNGIYELKDRSLSKKYYYTFAKVIDNRTLVKEEARDKYSIGVWVDVFPIDYVTDNIKTRKRVFWLKNTLYKMRMCKLLEINPLDTFASYIGYKYVPIPAFIVDWLIRKLIIRKTPTNTMSCMTENIRKPKFCFPAKVFESLSEYLFEGKKYMGVADADTYLTCHYGNYMQLPPEDQRTTHNFLAYWKE